MFLPEMSKILHVSFAAVMLLFTECLKAQLKLRVENSFICLAGTLIMMMMMIFMLARN
jgi:hypothetical protein